MRKPQEAEILYRTLFDQSPYGIMIVDINSKAVIEFNNAACTQLGYTRNEFIGMKISDFEAAETPEETKKHVAEIVRRGGDEFNTRYRTKYGEIRDYHLVSKPIELSGKKYLLSIHRDITERKRVEDALEINTRLLDSATDAIFLQDIEGNILYSNEKAYSSLGYSEEEFVKMNVRQLAAKDNKLKGRLLRELKEKGNVIFEDIVLHKDRSTSPIEVNARLIELKGQTLVLCVSRDITERKRIEQALTDETIRRRILVEQSRDGIVVLDQDGKVYEANQRFAEMLGYSPEEIRNLHVWDWEFQYPREQVQEMIRSVDETGDQFETKHRRKDGTTYDVSISTNGAIFSEQKLIFCVCRDITGQKRAEEELKLRAKLLDNATDSIFLHDFNDNFIYVNETMCKSHGYSKEEFMNMKLAALVIPEHVRLLGKQYQDLIEKGRDKFESAHFRKDGSVMPVEIHSSLIELEHKRLILTVARDITERKKAEEELRLRSKLLDNATDFIFLRELDGTYTYVNETALKALGYSREEFLKLKVDQLTASGYTWVKGSLMEELKEKDTVTFETVHQRKDGYTIPVESRSRLIESGDKKFILSNVRDITERKKLEEALRQLAYHDSLTGLPNRTLFYDHAKLALAQAIRHNSRFALLTMDLDKFKDINDTLGHDIGDKLLKEVGLRLESTVRKTDTISRMGGDEFELLILEMANEDDAANVVQKVLDMFRVPFVIDENKFNITASIGFAIYPKDGEDIDTLTKHADFAMYRVKQSGRNGYLRYTPDMDNKASRRYPSAPLITKQETINTDI